MSKEWKVIVSHSDLNVRIGQHDQPKPISQESFEFANKEEAVKKYVQSIDQYIKSSYDWKSHGMAAMKFYHEEDGKDILTYVLFYYKGQEYSKLTNDDLEKAGLE